MGFTMQAEAIKIIGAHFFEKVIGLKCLSLSNENPNDNLILLII